MNARATLLTVTIEALDELSVIEWFGHLGTAQSDTALAVRTLEDARDYMERVESENVRIEAANALFESIEASDSNRSSDWNRKASVLRPLARDVVNAKVRPAAEALGWPEKAVDLVRWDVIHYCMELEFATIVQPRFFAGLVGWYRRGHFPVAWDGKIEDGRVVVY